MQHIGLHIIFRCAAAHECIVLHIVGDQGTMYENNVNRMLYYISSSYIAYIILFIFEKRVQGHENVIK